MTYLSQISEEERKTIAEKARRSREDNRKREIEYAEKHFRVWADESSWRELASKHNINLPIWYQYPTEKRIKKFAKRLGHDGQWLKDVFGVDKISEIAPTNPNGSMLAHAGWILEAHDDECYG